MIPNVAEGVTKQRKSSSEVLITVGITAVTILFFGARSDGCGREGGAGEDILISWLDLTENRKNR